MNNTLISVIIPVYNTQEYLNRCIDSVIHQTYPYLQIIIINDGSKDSSENIIKSYKDSRIIYLSQKNHGQAHARNRALEIATGEYIYFIDSDDYIDINTIENCVKQLKKDCITVFGVNIVDNNIRADLEYKNGSYNSEKAFKMLLDFDMFTYSPCNKIISIDIIRKNKIYFPPRKGMEDFLFILKCFYYAENIFTNSGLYYFYNQRVGSTSKMFDKNKIDNTVEVILEIENFYHFIDNKKMYKYFINLYFSLIFDTLSLIIRYSNQMEKRENFNKFYSKIKNLNIYKIKNILQLNKINILRFIKFKMYDFLRYGL